MVQRGSLAGQASNMIPAAATAVVSGENLAKIAAAFPDFLAKKGLTGEIKETASGNGNCLKISLEGVSAHASVPWEWKNGACLPGQPGHRPRHRRIRQPG